MSTVSRFSDIQVIMCRVIKCPSDYLSVIKRRVIKRRVIKCRYTTVLVFSTSFYTNILKINQFRYD